MLYEKVGSDSKRIVNIAKQKIRYIVQSGTDAFNYWRIKDYSRNYMPIDDAWDR